MSGEMIQFECAGARYSGYLAKGEGPGVIVLQEYWGLVGHIKDVVDRFAAAGFNALAPDLYKGESTTEPEEAGKLMMALNIAETEKILRCAVTRLLSEATTQGDRAGVVGFCMGGQLSLYAACTNPEIGACVDYYGIHPNALPPLQELKAPLLGFFAEHDNYANAEAVATLDKLLTDLGKPHEFKTYAGTNHAFFNDHRSEVYNKEASEDSWNRMLAFFRKNLA